MLNIMGIVSSCFKIVCNDFKYVTYEGIEIHLEKPFVETGDSLLIQIRYLESDFIAQTFDNFFNSNALLAADCDKGWGGEKFPLTRISIKSDSDFNSEYLANQDLGKIAKVRGIDSNGEYAYNYLNTFNPADVTKGYLYITLRPETDKEHIFTIEFEKDNGEVVSAISETVTWE